MTAPDKSVKSCSVNDSEGIDSELTSQQRENESAYSNQEDHEEIKINNVSQINYNEY